MKKLIFAVIAHSKMCIHSFKKKFFFSKIKKPYIVGEIASAHLGDVKNLIYLSNQLQQSNSSALKFQIFKTENFVSKYNKYFKILKKLEISYKNWEYVFNKTGKLKINKICEIFEYESLVLLINRIILIALKSQLVLNEKR